MSRIQEIIEEVRIGGMPVFLRKLKSMVRYKIDYLSIISFPIAVPVIVMIRLIRPWIHIRFGYFFYQRIGHFAADVALALAENKLTKGNPYWNWYSLPKKTSNQQWAKMTMRSLRVRWWVAPLCFWNKILPGGECHTKHPAALTLGSRDKFNWVGQTSAQIPFMPEEEQTAKSWLQKQGWKEGEAFVCLLVRDDAYLSQNSLHKLSEQDNYLYKFRDSDISTYVQAAEYLAEQGLWVLRMGKQMNKPIPTQNPKIIDYAFHPGKSDLLDVWLFANCYFCISTGTGGDNLADIYRRPLLIVNFSSLSYLVSWNDCITVPKHLVWRKTEMALTLNENLENRFENTQDYDQAGIYFKDLTEQEITDAVKERLDRLNGTWQENRRDVALQNRFWEQFKAWSDFSKLHGWIHPEARIGSDFLRKKGSGYL
jgi:putative glycosyltransferase (TIGR04372 family)